MYPEESKTPKSYTARGELLHMSTSPASPTSRLIANGGLDAATLGQCGAPLAGNLLGSAAFHGICLGSGRGCPPIEAARQLLTGSMALGISASRAAGARNLIELM